MHQSTRRVLFPSMAIIFLFTACAPAPAATQNPEELQRLIQQSVEMAFTTHNAQATQQALNLALTPTQAAGPVDTLPDLPDSTVATPGPVDTLPDVPDSTTSASETEPAAPNATETTTSETCASSGDTSTPELPTQLKVGDTATIQRPVNLRTQPSLRNRILLTLKPGTQVEILAGPFLQRFAAGGEYLWWQIKLPGGLIGWSAELSVCRWYYFMEPVK